MGFIKNFFKRFSKNIEPREDISNVLVYMHPIRKRVVKVNATIDIQPNFAVVVVLNDKVTDVLSSGRHKVNGSTMPVTFQRLKLGKPTKRGNYKKWFKADIYFVNLKTFQGFKYLSDDPFYTKSDKFGRIKGYSEGLCNLTVKDAEELINYLLKRTTKIKPQYAEKEAGILVGNAVNKLIEKSKLHFSDILLKPEKLNKYLNPMVNEHLKEQGISVESVELHSLQLTKKVQKRVNEFLSNKAAFTTNGNSFELSMAEEEQEHVNEKVSEFAPAFRFNEEKQAKHVEQFLQQPAIKEEPEIKNPLLQRRLSGDNLINLHSGELNNSSNYSNANLNASEMLTNKENALKQCKYCGQAIEMHYKFCPKCGFKQAE